MGMATRKIRVEMIPTGHSTHTCSVEGDGYQGSDGAVHVKTKSSGFYHIPNNRIHCVIELPQLGR